MIGRAGEPMPQAGERLATARRPRESSIVPSDSIAGRALVSVIAIMSFLAALTLGGVVLVRAAAAEWQSAVAREVTIQVRPTEGRNIDAEVKKAADAARAFPGIAGVRPYSKEESTRLLEPWLGGGLALSDLPVPRLIVVKLSSEAPPDLAGLRRVLAERAAGASLDDHRGFVERMRAMAATLVAIGLGVLILVVAATMLCVTFATRGAMAANRPVVEVLHFVGAREAFIAGEFQRHFLLLGLKGSALGGGMAMLVLLAAGLAGDAFKGSAGDGQVSALFGSFSFGLPGYAAIVGLMVMIAVVTAGTSRLVVFRTLRSMG